MMPVSKSNNDPRLVYIVILTWNGKQNTLDCLLSLESVWSEHTRGIVVDNGSSDGTAEAVRANYPELIVLRNEENLGFTGGNNVGMRDALNRGADYILLLNNDTIVDPEFVGKMLEVALSSDRIGFVSPKICFADSPDLLWFAGARFNPLTGYGRVIGYREKDRGQYDDIREIDRPCGCAVLVSRRLCEEAGLLDPGIFLYMDEVEWMLRARKKGFTSFYAPKAKVWHKVSASVGRESHPDAFYYGVRNTLYALNRNASLGFAPINWMRSVVVVAVFFLSVLLSDCSLREGFDAMISGAIDYHRDRFGRRS